ncbi:MAG: tyrosine-protein phosphatase [Candidatus Azobacteroides sp.]|nr:tyrosine-protein phosphatase [Candidatus Azobacteroides sp.]
MLRNSTFWILSLLLFSHCAQEKPDIRVVCETVPPGCYKIKWETFPPMEGTVKIYESSTPDSFNISSPIAETEISTGFKDILFVQSTKRSYFQLVFNKKYSVITAERTIPMEGLIDFRDLGGYYNTAGKQTRWGKLYRSTSLANATLQDAKVLNNLGIRTIIDFRTDKERYDAPSKYSTLQVINFPLRGNPYNLFFDKILSKEMKAGDVRVYLQDLFAFLLENNSEYFIKMFDILLDANNYPILLHCSMGSDRSAVASALILAALDIDLDQIISDYMLTNEHEQFDSLVPINNIFLEDQEIQETFTALFRAHKGTITYSFDRIMKEYGSVDHYFTTELKLSARKREKLKEIMLY